MATVRVGEAGFLLCPSFGLFGSGLGAVGRGWQRWGLARPGSCCARRMSVRR